MTDELFKTLNKLVQQNIIAPVDEPQNWASNIVIVKKSDNSLRNCLDPHHLNKVIKRDYFLIPTFSEVRSRLAPKKYFSFFDLKDGFWHIPLTDQSSNLCTFSTPHGYFKFLRLPFGLACAPEVFQKVL